MSQPDTYAERGVSSEKKAVQTAVTASGMSKGLYPGAFCRITEDVLAGSPNHCNIQHVDGSGTKVILAHLQSKRDFNPLYWHGPVADSLAMNIDDVACVGVTTNFLVSMLIGRNAYVIPDEAIGAMIKATQELCTWLTSLGVHCTFTSGETADLATVRSVTVDHVVTTRARREEIIDASWIASPGFIVGFSSTGKAIWETEENSGIGSNGLTSAIHDVLGGQYRIYGETFPPEMPEKLVYCGKHRLVDHMPGSKFTIGAALWSPTRFYAPLIQKIIATVGVGNILGLIHCTGGGQTKIGNFGKPGTVYVKDNLFPFPPLFELIQRDRKLTFEQMFKTYNCGHLLDAVVPTLEVAEQCIKIAGECGIEARVIGHLERYEVPGNKRTVVIRHAGESITYDFPVKS